MADYYYQNQRDMIKRRLIASPSGTVGYANHNYEFKVKKANTMTRYCSPTEDGEDLPIILAENRIVAPLPIGTQVTIDYPNVSHLIGTIVQKQGSEYLIAFDTYETPDKPIFYSCRQDRITVYAFPEELPIKKQKKDLLEEIYG